MVRQLLQFGGTSVIGLDIGNHAVKMVQISHGQDGMTATAAAIEPVDISESNGTSSDNAVAAIKNCLRRTRAKTRNSVCNLSGTKVAVRAFSFPPMPAEKIEAAVMLEASQVCPFDVANGTVDYQLVPAPGADNGNAQASDAPVAGVMVAAENSEIEKRRSVVRAAGLHCAIIDNDSLAMLNCYNELERRGSDACPVILDVGGSSMSIIMQSADGLPFIRDFNYGGNYIVGHIAEEHDLSVETVQNALKADDETVPLRKELVAAMCKACGRIAREVVETLRYRMTQSRNLKVQEVLVCGGFALTPGFVETLGELLSIKTKLWNPFDRIACQGDADAIRTMKENGPSLVVAAGLAMRSL